MAGSNISLTYNGVTVGGDQFALQLHDYMIDFAYDSFSVEAVISIHGGDAGTFNTLRANTVASLTAFSKDFSLLRGATVIWSVDESEKTSGYLARPTIKLLNVPEDHELRQTFRWVCTFMRGATSTEDEGGRLAAQISVTTDQAGYNTISISGTYTAVPVNATLAHGKLDAREAYNANVGAFVTGILTLIGGAQYKVVADTYQFDEEAARLMFTATRRQVKVPENAAGTFESGIREQTISLSSIDTSSLGIPRNRVTMFQASYTALLDTAVVAHTGQQAFYENTILPHVVTLLRSLYVGDTVAIDNHQRTYRHDLSSISVSLQGFATFGDGDLIGHEREVSYQLSTQKEFRERWDGRQHSRISETPGPLIEAEVIVEETVIGDPRLRGIDNVSSGPASSPGAFDLEREANYMRPGVPPFPSAYTLAFQRPPGNRVAIAGAPSSSSGTSSTAGGAPATPQAAPAAYPADSVWDTTVGGTGLGYDLSAGVFDINNVPLADRRTRVDDEDSGDSNEAGGQPPTQARESDGGGAGDNGGLRWVLLQAVCRARGKFVGYNKEPGQEFFSKVKRSTTTYITNWVWAIETSSPVATVLVQPGSPSISPDATAQRGQPG